MGLGKCVLKKSEIFVSELELNKKGSECEF